MNKITQLEFEVLPITEIQIVGGKTLKLVLDYNAIAKAQKEIGRDLARPEAWFNPPLNSSETTALGWAALDRYQPEITLREFRQMLPPAAYMPLLVMLMEQCWPGFVERFEKLQNEPPPLGEVPNAEAVASV